jgi:hypothetical protein
MVNTWKILAIVFMLLFITESCVFGYAMYSGAKEINNDIECNTICFNLDSYKYLYEGGVCKCYEYESETPFHQEIMK